MNRFKTSKYKNTTPKIPKKDGWIANVRGGSFSSQGKHIKSSCSLVAFNTDQAGGGMVGLSSVNAASDGKWIVTQISCHADLVTDLDFSPFDDYLLATCSTDETVKLWRVCDLDQDQPSNAEVTLSAADGRLEIVLFHPVASGLLTVASARGVQVWDVTRDAALTGKHTPSAFIPTTITALNTRFSL
ncbi:coronin-7-like, partial [Sinocyclocheilus rhinocerous]|uniref:coronin-7-like n=1 Tax=Sinocyclocheilus rhinocerous TaxID=307959 RepID=UPI0007B98FA0